MVLGRVPSGRIVHADVDAVALEWAVAAAMGAAAGSVAAVVRLCGLGACGPGSGEGWVRLFFERPDSCVVAQKKKICREMRT